MFGRVGVRRAAGIALVIVATGGWASSPVHALSAPIQISGTEGEGVLIQSEPNAASARLGWMPEGASPEYNCFTHGEMVGTVRIALT